MVENLSINTRRGPTAGPPSQQSRDAVHYVCRVLSALAWIAIIFWLLTPKGTRWASAARRCRPGLDSAHRRRLLRRTDRAFFRKTLEGLPYISSRGCDMQERGTFTEMKNKLRVLRAERNWSQGELSQRLGVSRQAINAIETEKHDPSLDLAFKMGDLFGMTIEQIFEPEKHKNSQGE